MYKFITVRQRPRRMDEILDTDHPANQAAREEEAMAMAAPTMLLALRRAQGRLRHLLTVFSSPRFTDRYGDAEQTRQVLELVDAAITAAEPTTVVRSDS